MTIEHRRALIGRLIDKEAAAGRAIDRDADFMALVELWIEGDIDMPAMRRRYKLIRGERLENKRASLTRSQPLPPDAFSDAHDLVAELGLLAEPEVRR